VSFDIPLTQAQQLARETLDYGLSQAIGLRVKADERIAPAQHAMLFLDFKKLKWKDHCRHAQLRFRKKQRNHDLLLAPSTVQRTILFEDGAVVRRHQEEDIQVGPSRNKFSSNGTAVKQHTFQLLPEHGYNLLHICSQQLLCVVRQSLDHALSR